VSQTITLILVFGLFAAIIILIIVAGVQGRRRIAQFEQACRDRGWVVTRGDRPGFSHTISGSTGGVGWRYDFFNYSRGSTRRGNRSQTQSARLLVDSVNLPGEIVMVMPRNAQASQLGQTIQAMNQFGGLGRKLIELLVVEGLNGDMADVDNFLRLQPAMSGSEALREKYSVLATREDTAAQVLERCERPLLEFVSDPALSTEHRAASMLLWSKGLTLPIERQISDVTKLEGMANLAAKLANSIKGW